MNTATSRAITEAITRAAVEAAAKGVTVTVEIHEGGFFPSEKLDVSITATPPKKES